ncbi:hypothetical protein PPH41_43310, partial [Burkholderia gladioli]|nr:hypothetical protein [Burkholderia gladioli]
MCSELISPGDYPIEAGSNPARQIIPPIGGLLWRGHPHDVAESLLGLLLLGRLRRGGQSPILSMLKRAGNKAAAGPPRPQAGP